LGTTSTPVTVQITPESKPAVPTWMGEVAAFAHVLTHTGMLKTIQEEVRFARARFGYYDLIDFVAVLIGYILSGEPTLPLPDLDLTPPVLSPPFTWPHLATVLFLMSFNHQAVFPALCW